MAAAGPKAMETSEVAFSVVLATRNRPASLGVALESVLHQTLGDREVIVVNDGSSEDHSRAYQALEEQAGGQARFLKIPSRPNGHGPSSVRNFGASWARGRYLCFLDDDDLWTDHHYLECARDVIEHSEQPVDLLLADQAAFFRNNRKEGPIWIEGLADILRAEGRLTDAHGAYSVTVVDLLRCGGFCHLNTTVVRRALFEEIGGLDENTRYEEDRDFYLRVLDRAERIKYLPRAVARHNIPDAGTRSGVLSADLALEKLVFQLRVFDKAILFGRHPAIRAHGRLHKAYTLKKIAEELAKTGRTDDALHYARLGLGARPTWKWLGYTAWQIARLIGSRVRSRVGRPRARARAPSARRQAGP